MLTGPVPGQPTDEEHRVTTPKGLENVPVASTELSFIDGQEGVLIYRGYEAVDLAMNCTFEDVWHLLYYGDLPSDASFERRMAELRELPLSADTLRALASDGRNYMSSLQAAISATGAVWGVRNANNAAIEDMERDAL